MIAKEKCVLVDSLQKQEEGRDGRGRFLKGQSGNPQGGFRKGQSGNPGGRRPGSRNKATEIAELLLAGEVEALTRKAVELARVVEIFVRAVEASDFERRLKALEEQFAEDADLTRMTWPAGT